jgi:hypothetical protein
MGWEDQGRQDHGWFGHGTAPPGGEQPPKGGAGATFDPANIAARIDAIAYSAVAHMPRPDRQRDGAAFNGPRLERLRRAMTAWMGARSLSQGAFGERFVDPSTSGTAIEKLRAAAEGARTATTQRDLADASADLAGAMREIGLEKWSRFLSDAAERAGPNGPSGGKTVLAQLAMLNSATDANPTDGPDPGSDPELAEFRKRFEAATTAAYRQYSHDCSHYLRTFLQNMGLAETPYRTANDFMNYVHQPGSGWRSVSAEEAVRQSAKGHIVVAGLAQRGESGHVAVVGPRMIPAPLAGGHPMSPQLFSGATSSWPGSRSQGEHSVADGWAGRDRRYVSYWVKQ